MFLAVTHTILFTGHMVDAHDRKVPRFPASKENNARDAIKKELMDEKQNYHDLQGIAGGASGGDILFHEVCKQMNIPNHVFLAMPANEFMQHSVSFAGADWEIRFNKLINSDPVSVLNFNKESEDNVWEQANMWMLNEALKAGGENMTLIALWDGKGGDGPGGTEHMVRVAKEQGAKIKIIDITKL